MFKLPAYTEPVNTLLLATDNAPVDVTTLACTAPVKNGADTLLLNVDVAPATFGTVSTAPAPVVSVIFPTVSAPSCEEPR